MNELAGLTDEARKLALDRFRLLQPHLEQNQSLQTVARAVGIPYRTAHRWVSQYRHFGLVALTRKTREDRGERRAASTRLREVIEGLALEKPPLPIAALYRQVRRRLGWSRPAAKDVSAAVGRISRCNNRRRSGAWCPRAIRPPLTLHGYSELILPPFVGSSHGLFVPPLKRDKPAK